jgi:hypothetical protein
MINDRPRCRVAVFSVTKALAAPSSAADTNTEVERVISTQIPSFTVK